MSAISTAAEEYSGRRKRKSKNAPEDLNSPPFVRQVWQMGGCYMPGAKEFVIEAMVEEKNGLL